MGILYWDRVKTQGLKLPDLHPSFMGSYRLPGRICGIFDGRTFLELLVSIVFLTYFHF